MNAGFLSRETGLPTRASAEALAFLAEAIGGILQVVILPWLVYGLFMRQVPSAARMVSTFSALAMSILAVASAMAPELEATRLDRSLHRAHEALAASRSVGHSSPGTLADRALASRGGRSIDPR